MNKKMRDKITKFVNLENKALSYKIGFLLGGFHLLIILLILYALPSSGQSGIGLMIVLETIDIHLAPLFGWLMDNMIPKNAFVGFIIIIFVNGILGTLTWFLVPIVIAKVITKIK